MRVSRWQLTLRLMFLSTSVSIINWDVWVLNHFWSSVEKKKTCMYCWTSNCPACSKIEGGFKSQSIEIYWSEQRSALGCLSDQRLTEKQHQGNISQHIYRYCVDLCHFLVGRQNRPTSISFFVLQLLGTECSHSVYFFVFYVLVASSNCPSVIFLCTQGYLHITSHYIPQCTKKHISYSS